MASARPDLADLHAACGLAQTTPAAWAPRACRQLPSLLIEQAHLEKKAAAGALRLMFWIPQDDWMQRALSALAREELVHFERALRQLDARGIAFDRQPPSAYAETLKAAARAMPERLLGELLVSALIEARSHERMGLLANALTTSDPGAADFYRELVEAEGRHHGVYLDLAVAIAGAPAVLRCWPLLAAREAAAVAGPFSARLHGGGEAMPKPDGRPVRRRRRWLAVLLLTPYPLAVGGGMEPSIPFDWALNLGDASVAPALRAKADGRRRLVVLQHGLWRSPAALARLERALQDAGYATLNPGYPSRSCTIEAAAKLLRDAVERELAAGPADVDLAFVAHSLGGLVVQEYLRQPQTRAPFACVYIGVPHRGAVLCDLRKHWWPFPLLMGTAAALQLSPGDPFHRQPIPFVDRSGAIVGDRGAGNAAIPGDDDGTVACSEATLAGAKDVVHLPHGHTAIATADATVQQVLTFLRDGRFAH